MDTEDIPLGVDFREHIRGFIEQAEVVLAIIGPGWNAVGETGRRRLSSSRDWVRIEIMTALAGGVPVVPVCVDGAEIPQERHLPKALREFAYKQAAYIDSGRNFEAHMDRLSRDIDMLVEKRRPQPRQTWPESNPRLGSAPDRSQLHAPTTDPSASTVAEVLARQLSEISKGQQSGGTPGVQFVQSPDFNDAAGEPLRKRKKKSGDATEDWSSLRERVRNLARKEV